MIHPIVLPALGESVSEATITRWLKKPGDAVTIGEPIVEVSTDKVDTEVSSTHTGTVESITVAEGDTVSVGVVLANVSDDEHVLAASNVLAGPQVSKDPDTVTSLPEVRPAAKKDFLSPMVRRLGRETGLDPREIRGTGEGGRVRKSDILSAASGEGTYPTAPQGEEHEAPSKNQPDSATSQSAEHQTVPLSRLRRVIAKRAVESLVTTAQLTTIVEVDVTNVDTVRKKRRDGFAARTGVKLTFLPFFAVAATRALRDFPIIGSRLEDDNIVFPAESHVNFAVDTDRGLYSPVVKNAAELDVEGFALAIHEVAERARKDQLTLDDQVNGIFTITNTGSRGALLDTPIVFLPQVAILGVGAVTRKPVVVSDSSGEGISIRSMAYLALSYDHRIIDGADASRYLSAVKGYLEGGEFSV